VERLASALQVVDLERLSLICVEKSLDLPITGTDLREQACGLVAERALLARYVLQSRAASDALRVLEQGAQVLSTQDVGDHDIGQSGGAMTPEAIYNVLRTTADDLGEPGKDAIFGNGRVNAARAVGAL